MGLIKNLVKLGIAKKIYDEARKPENQQRMKDAVASFKERQNRNRTPPS
jgi:hypothetical protein